MLATLDFLDIQGDDIKLGVQVEIREDGKVLWVSIDGVTVLRICKIPSLEVNDCRDEGKPG
jgi:hypothetical protein